MNTKTDPAPSASLPIGATASATILVSVEDLATVLHQAPEDAFPPVYATSRMIGLMELAPARCARPCRPVSCRWV